VSPPSPFEKMRQNRRRQPRGQSRADKLLARIDDLEAQMVEEWRAVPARSQLAVVEPHRRRLFGWLTRS